MALIENKMLQFSFWINSKGNVIYYIECKSTIFWGLIFKFQIKWATSWENLFMSYANNKGANQTAHPVFVVRYLHSIIPLHATAEIPRLASFCSWAGRFGSDLVETPKTGFLVTWLKLKSSLNRWLSLYVLDKLDTVIILCYLFSVSHWKYFP